MNTDTIMIKSAGLLNYRFVDNKLQILLCKTGGPRWENVIRSWNIPKGKLECGEDSLTAAVREFNEETGLQLPLRPNYTYLGNVKTYSNNKVVDVYGFNFDYGDNITIKSNSCNVEWPIGLGKYIIMPELSEGKYFNIDDIYIYMYKYQYPIVHRLIKKAKELYG